MKQENLQKALEAVANSGITVNGDFVLEKHVEYEIGNVENGGIGIQVNNGKDEPNIEVNAGGKVTLVQDKNGLWHTEDAEEAEVVEEVKEVAGECDDLLVNDVFSDELFMTNQQLLKLRTIINESIGMGNQDTIDLSKGLEWSWLYQAIYDAGLFETRSNRENVVTVVGFVRQIAKWFPDIIDIDDEERIRNICKSVSAEQGKWMMNGKPVNLVDIEANKRRITAMKPAKIERIVRVAYNGLYTKLVALKQEIAKEKATR